MVSSVQETRQSILTQNWPNYWPNLVKIDQTIHSSLLARSWYSKLIWYFGWKHLVIVPISFGLGNVSRASIKMRIMTFQFWVNHPFNTTCFSTLLRGMPFFFLWLNNPQKSHYVSKTTFLLIHDTVSRSFAASGSIFLISSLVFNWNALSLKTCHFPHLKTVIDFPNKWRRYHRGRKALFVDNGGHWHKIKNLQNYHFHKSTVASQLESHGFFFSHFVGSSVSSF